MLATLDVGGAKKSRSEMAATKKEANTLKAAFEKIDRAADTWNKIEAGLSRIRDAIQRTRASAARPITVTVAVEGAKEVLATFKRIEVAAGRLSGRDPNITVTADTAQALTQLRAFSGQLTRLTNRSVDVPVSVETAGATAELRAFLQRVNSLAGRKVRVPVGADTSAGKRDLDAFSSYLVRLSARSVSVPVDADTGKARASLDALLSLIRRVAGARAVVRAEAETAGATSALATLKRAVDSLKGATVRVHAEATGFASVAGVLGELDRKAAEIDRRWGHSVTIHAEPSNIDDVVARLRRLGLEATKVNDTEIDIPVDVDDANARTRLEAMRALVRSMSSEGVSINAGLDDAMARVGLAELERRISEVDGRNIRINTSGASSAVSSLATGIRSLATIARAASIPFFVSGIAGIVPVAVAAAAGVGALASAVGQGLVGALASAGGAAAGMAGAVGLIAAAVGPTVSALSNHKAASKAVESATKAAAQAGQAYADASSRVEEVISQRGQTELDVSRQIGAAWEEYERQQEKTGQVVRQVAKQSSDAWDEYGSSREKTGQVEEQVAQDSAKAWQGYRDSVESTKSTVQQVAQANSDAWRDYQDTIKSTGRTTQEVAQSNSDAWKEYISTREQTARAEDQASQASQDAADTLRSARTDLMASTTALARVQREYNDILEDEPENRQYAALDLADAYDQVTDDLEAYNEALREHGKGSEEAGDAARRLQRSQLDYGRQQEKTTEIQKTGSQELRDSFGQLVSAQTERINSSVKVGEAEENAGRVARQASQQVSDARKAESAQYESYLRTQKQGSQQIADSKAAEARAYEAYRRSEAKGAEQVAASRKAEADQYKAYLETQRQGSQQIADSKKSEAQAYEAYRRVEAEGAQQIRESRRAENDQYKAWQQTKQQGDRQLEQAQDAVTEAQLAASRAADALAESQKAAGEAGEQAGAKLSASQDALLSRLKAFKEQYEAAFRGANDAFNYLATDVLDFASGALPTLGRAAGAAIGGLAAAFATLRGEITQSGQLGLFNEYLSRIPTFTQLGAEALGRLGLSAANVFVAAMPAGERFLARTNEIFAALLSYTQSLEGQAALRSYFDGAAAAAAVLLGVVVDFGVGLVGLGAAFQQSGLTTYMLTGLANLAARFREGMSATGSWRDAVVSFSTASVPILDALRGLVGAAVREVLLLADNLVRIRTPEGAPILVSTLNQIAMALPAIRRGLEAAFANWGPLIGPAIMAASSLFEVFIANNPVLQGIVRGIIGLVNWFAQLPAPIQQVAVAATTGALILGKLGGIVWGLVTPLVALAARLGITGAFLMGPWGIAMAAAVAAGVLLWRNWDQVKAAATPLTDALKGIWGTLQGLGAFVVSVFSGNMARAREIFASLPPSVRPFADALGYVVIEIKRLASQGIQFLQDKVAQFRAWWAEAWPQIRNAVMPILAAVASGIRTGVGTALSFLIEKGRQLVAWFQQNWPAFKAAVMPVLTAVASGIRTGVGAAFAFLVDRAGQIVSWFQQNWPLIKETARTVFEGIVSFVRGGITLARDLVVNTWNEVVGFWRRNNDQIVSIARSVWNIVRNTVDTSIRIAGNLIRAGMQIINGDWSAAWASVKRALQLAWDLIKSNVGEALKIVGNLIRIGWDEAKNATVGFGRDIKNTILGMWDYVSSRFTMGKDHAVRRIAEMAQWIGDRFVQFRDFVGTKARELWDNVSSRFTGGKDHAIMRIREMTDWIGAKWREFRDYVGTKAKELWDDVSSRFTRGKDHAIQRFTEMRDDLFDLGRSMRDGVGGLFAEMGKGMVRHIVRGINQVRQFLGVLLDGAAAVLEAIGMKDQAGKLKDTAGNLKADIPVAYARGGVWNADRGGVGNGRTIGAITNEAGDREAIVNLDRRTPESQRAFRAAADSPNAPREYRASHAGLGAGAAHIHQAAGKAEARLRKAGYAALRADVAARAGLPTENAGPRLSRAGYVAVPEREARAGGMMAEGAESVNGASRWDYYDFIKSKVDSIVAGVGGGVSHNSYWNHFTSPGANDHSTVDFWAPSGRGTAIGYGKGEAVVGQVLRNHAAGLLNILWNFKSYVPGGGWSSWGGIPHDDHVHVAWGADPNAKTVSGGGGGLGGWWSSVKDAAGNVFGSAADAIKGLFPKVPDLSGMGTLGSGLQGWLKKLWDDAKGWVMDQASSFGGSSGGGATPGGPGDYGPFGSASKAARYMAGQAEARGIPGELPVMTSLVESELMTGPRVRFSDLDSAGPMQIRTQLHGWSIADAENYGLATNRWFLDNAQRYKGQYDHSAAGLGAWAQRVQGSAYPDRYAQRYDEARRLVGYLAGGVIPGAEGMPKFLMAHAGERVLPVGVADAFERLSNSIVLWSRGVPKETTALGTAIARGAIPGAAPAGAGGGTQLVVHVHQHQDFSGMRVGAEFTPEEIREMARRGGREGANEALNALPGTRRAHSQRIATRRT